MGTGQGGRIRDTAVSAGDHVQLPHSSGLGSPETIFGHAPLMPPTAERGGVGSRLAQKMNS